jgi:Flp pilus assembly protein TadG
MRFLNLLHYKSIQENKGVVAIELAILLPVILLMLMAVTDFARIFYAGITLVNAAHAGAQYATQNLAHMADRNQIIQVVMNDAQDLADVEVSVSCQTQCPNQISIACGEQCADSQAPEKSVVQVTGSHEFKTLFPWPGIPAVVSLRWTSVMRAQ